jgi:diguanylate cyclase (GGDEF)-like protein/PAS domain S-box-containing protein
LAGTEKHRLLRRQLRRIFGTEIDPEGEWAALLSAVSDAYYLADRERHLVENALEVNGQELTEANIKLRLLIDNAPAGIVMLDRELRCIFASRRWLQDRRMELKDIVGKGHFEVVPEMQGQWAEVLHRCLDGATESCDEEPIPQPDGTVDWIKWEVRPWYETKGLVSGLIVMSEDITHRKHAEEQMRIAAVAFQSRDGMIVTDADGMILQVNQAFTAVTGYRAEEAVGRTPVFLRSGRHDAAFYRHMWEALKHEGSWAGEIWNRRKDGGVYPEWLSISGVKNSGGKFTHYLGTYSDIRDPKEAERKILELAFYDPLTGLPNRRLLLDRLNHAMAASAREGQFGAMLLLDLDHFKTLNDTRGHDVGDQLLVEVARRLVETLRDTDSAARLGGDEFVILLEGLHEEQTAAATKAELIAEKIRAAISKPATLQNNEYHATPSIGVTLFCDRGEGAETLFRQADLALYQAKDAGRDSIRFYSPTMQALVDERAELEAGLRRALAENEFLLYYQPQVDSRGAIVGAEALLRWQPPGQPMIAPDSFIPVAEDSGLIVPISSWVLESACRLLARWAKSSSTQDLQLSINISARQFNEADFVEEVKSALQRFGARPERLMLELTESLLLKNVDKAILTMKALKEFGVGFSIDDFGIGYSSLSYLKRLPLDQIKIDRSFVNDIIDDSDDRAIVQAIISLGHSLDLDVIAEGVETAAQRDFLAAHYCQTYQGYLFSKPVPVEDFQRLLPGFAMEMKSNYGWEMRTSMPSPNRRRSVSGARRF